jgi:hypothetical protein
MAMRVAEALLCAGLAGITFAGLTSSSQTSIVDFLCVRIMRVLCKKPKHLLTFAGASCCGIASSFSALAQCRTDASALFISVDRSLTGFAVGLSSAQNLMSLAALHRRSLQASERRSSLPRTRRRTARHRIQLPRLHGRFLGVRRATVRR